jgi:hypothetical protein
LIRSKRAISDARQEAHPAEDWAPDCKRKRRLTNAVSQVADDAGVGVESFRKERGENK